MKFPSVEVRCSRVCLLIALLFATVPLSAQDAQELSPGEGEVASGDAVVRSAVRGSLLRRGSLQSQFSPEEKNWIADNCPFGMPREQEGAGLGPMRIIVRQGYVVGHSAEARIPYWVCEHAVPDEFIGLGDREKSSFLPEPKLAGESRAELSDYSRSGYDRGHMHPAANAKKSQEMMDETHFLSNMLPQYGSTFNRGIWAKLEDSVRKWTRTRGDCWIVSGPVFYDPLEEQATTADGLVPYYTIGENEVAVPTHCFKIVLSKNKNGEWETIAFVFANQRHEPPYRLSLYRTTVDWIEDRAGLDIFPELSSNPANIALLNRLEGIKSEMWEAD